MTNTDRVCPACYGEATEESDTETHTTYKCGNGHDWSVGKPASDE